MPDPLRPTLQFDVDKYIRNLKKIDTENIDLSQAAHYPITEQEIHALTSPLSHDVGNKIVESLRELVGKSRSGQTFSLIRTTTCGLSSRQY